MFHLGGDCARLKNRISLDGEKEGKGHSLIHIESEWPIPGLLARELGSLWLALIVE